MVSYGLEKLTDQHRPHSDKHKQPQICPLLQRKEQRVYMVGETLRPSIQRVKRIAGERCRHRPFMVWFVKPAIDERVMQTTVYPVNPTVCEADEQWILEHGVSEERRVAGEII